MDNALLLLDIAWRVWITVLITTILYKVYEK